MVLLSTGFMCARDALQPGPNYLPADITCAEVYTSTGGERLDLDETTIAEVFKQAGTIH